MPDPAGPTFYNKLHVSRQRLATKGVRVQTDLGCECFPTKEINHGTRTLAQIVSGGVAGGLSGEAKGGVYQPWVIVAVILWGALHDRPRNWACQQKNWSTTTFRPLKLPSPSVLSRRADSVGVGLF